MRYIFIVVIFFISCVTSNILQNKRNDINYIAEGYINSNNKHVKICSKYITVYLDFKDSVLLKASLNAMNYWNNQNLGVTFSILSIGDPNHFISIQRIDEDEKVDKIHLRLATLESFFLDNGCIHHSYLVINPITFKGSDIFIESIIRHELGHAMGLHHTKSNSNIKTLMSAVISFSDIKKNPLELHQVEKFYLKELYKDVQFEK